MFVAFRILLACEAVAFRILVACEAVDTATARILLATQNYSKYVFRIISFRTLLMTTGTKAYS